jgi:uncharacterized membrane protein YdjX (TVP38/TMEM64 family)
MLISWPEQLSSFMHFLVRTYGYLGVFIVLLLSNATILLPIPGIFVIFVAGAILNPIGVALAGGLGAAFGELTGYYFGRGSGKLLRKRLELKAVSMIYRKYGLWSIYLFAAFPFPFDVIGILCGVLGIDPRVFWTLTFAGKTTSYILYAYTGREGLHAILSLLRRETSIGAIFFILVVAAFMIGASVFWNYRILRREYPKPQMKLRVFHALIYRHQRFLSAHDRSETLRDRDSLVGRP